jgi:hypothetical protein
MRREYGRAYLSYDTEVGAEPSVAHEDDSSRRSVTAVERERRLAWWWLLVAVGAAFLLTQLVFFPFGRPANWDEAVYLSQVTPGMDALFMDAWRSRGITLLIAPVSLLGGTLSDVRLYLTIASAAAVTMAFRVWIPLIGLAAPIAAFLFSFTWLGLLNGSALMPNLWAAILGVAAAGLVGRRLEGGSFGQAVLAAILLGMMALTRPTDATVLTGAIGLYLLLVRRSSWRFGLALGLGLFLGWLPWLLEMSIRFGGLSGAFHRSNSAGHVSLAPISEHVASYLRFTYGRKALPVGQFPVEGILWWSLLLVLAAIALFLPAERRVRSMGLLSFLATGASAFEYLVLVRIVAARFLLPAYAFAAITAAVGVVSLFRRGVAGRVIGAVVLVSIVPWALWQLDVARGVLAGQLRPAERYYEAGLLLRDLAGDGPCSFVSPAVHPQVQIASGCSGGKLTAREPTTTQLAAAASGEEVFIILPHKAERGSRLAALDPTRFRSTHRTWFIYQLSQLVE